MDVMCDRFRILPDAEIRIILRHRFGDPLCQRRDAAVTVKGFGILVVTSLAVCAVTFGAEFPVNHLTPLKDLVGSRVGDSREARDRPK